MSQRMRPQRIRFCLRANERAPKTHFASITVEAYHYLETSFPFVNRSLPWAQSKDVLRG